MWVVSGGLYGAIGVGGGGILVGRRPRGDWVRLFYSGVGYAIVGCRVEAVCGLRWDLRFALENVELIGGWLFPSVARFMSAAGWAGY